MADRVFNFSPGPAVLPLSVLEEAQKELISYKGSGMSVLEMSHRSKQAAAIFESTEANLRQLLNIPDNYHVLFLQGGASLQFSMIPINLLRGQEGSADYIITGSWGSKAIKEAQREGQTANAWDGKPDNYNRVPDNSELNLNPNALYVHYTSNETIQGVQFSKEPEVGNVPLICDASSDFMCRPIPITKYALLYAGAQKNAGPAGVTLVILRNDLIERMPKEMHSLLNYGLLAENKSIYNTPPVFAIYIVGLVTQWLLGEIGGLAKMETINRKKAQLLYDVIDSSDGFYKGHALPGSRSIMNVTWVLPSDDLTKQFVSEAAAEGLTELKGHRSVGGIRASIYNAMPTEGVEKLADFMNRFRKKN